jgi:uncharacterized protein (TIGR02145 family)
VKDLVGSAISLSLNNGDDDSEEDTDLIGTTVAPTTTALPPLLDKDGNEYTTVTIGTQEWIVENFRSETYADDSAIPNLTVDLDWSSDATGAYCYYDNDEATYKGTYGALYNWYAINNVKGLSYLERSGVEEIGWRVPTEADFTTLSTFLGGDLISGGKLKEVGTTHWDAPNTGATDEEGFMAMPSGIRISTGTFLSIGESLEFGTSTESSPTELMAIGLSYDSAELVFDIGGKTKGYAIRLVRDI